MEDDQFFLYTKVRFKCSDELWARVVSYKIEKRLKNNNDALKELAVIGLEAYKAEKNAQLCTTVKP